MTCLIDLIRSLDRDRFEPVVLTYQANTGYESALEAVGARVVSLNRPSPPPSTRGGAQTGHETAPPWPFWRQAKRLLRYEIPVGRTIAKIIRQEGVDLVHNNDNPRGDRASMVGAWMAGVPQVSHVRYTPSYYPFKDRNLARMVRRFVPMSSAIKAHMEQNLGRISTPIEVVHDPFHFDVHDAALAENPVDRGEWGFGPGDYVVANVGRIVPWKGQDVFLRALRKTVDVHPHTRAVIVGGPMPHDTSKSFWNHLQSLTKELDLASFVRFTGFRTDVAGIMSASDLVVHSSTMPEPFGKVLVEAMASRRPVVATAGGGPLEIVEHGQTGLLVPASDPDAMADALIAIVGHPERSRAMGDHGRAVAEARYGTEAFRNTMTRIFDEALGAKRRAS